MSTAAEQPTAPTRPYTFHGMIPLLRELLPKQHGRPGVTYAQVYLLNQRRAEDEGWRRIDGTAVYTIQGPKGSCDMILMGRGKPISGVGHASGKRKCYVDLAVEQITGLPVKSTPLNVTNGSNTNAGSVSQVSESKGGKLVQRSEQAAQR